MIVSTNINKNDIGDRSIDGKYGDGRISYCTLSVRTAGRGNKSYLRIVFT